MSHDCSHCAGCGSHAPEGEEKKKGVSDPAPAGVVDNEEKDVEGEIELDVEDLDLDVDADEEE